MSCVCEKDKYSATTKRLSIKFNVSYILKNISWSYALATISEMYCSYCINKFQPCLRFWKSQCRAYIGCIAKYCKYWFWCFVSSGVFLLLSSYIQLKLPTSILKNFLLNVIILLCITCLDKSGKDISKHVYASWNVENYRDHAYYYTYKR